MSADDLVALVGGSAGAVLLAVVIARYAWVHRSRLITPRAAETVGTQLERHFLDLFTNQDEALARVGDVYRADDAVCHVVEVWGAPGSGKTWLLRRIAATNRETGLLTAQLDFGARSLSTPLDVLLALERQLTAGGRSLPAFASRLAGYRAIQRSGPSAGVASAAVIPRLEQHIALLDPAGHERATAALQAMFGKDGVDLAVAPDPKLTDGLIQDLQHIGDHLVLLVDHFDEAAALDPWFRGLIARLPAPTTVFVACQRPLGLEWQGVTRIALGEFGPDDAAACLERYASAEGMSLDERSRQDILDFARGLPRAIAAATVLMGRYGTSTFAEVQPQALDDLARSFLRAVPPEQRGALEICAIPRWLNEDLIASIAPEASAPALYAFLGELPFSRPIAQGLELAEPVRAVIAAQLQQRAPARWTAVQRACLSHHTGVLTGDARLHTTLDPGVRNAAREAVHHAFAIDPEDGFKLSAQLMLAALDAADLDFVLLLLRELEQQRLGPSAMVWVDLWHGERHARRAEWDRAEARLRPIVEADDVGHSAHPSACTTLGRIAYVRGDLTRAAKLYEAALRTPALHESDRSRGYVVEQLAKVRRMEGRLSEALTLHEQAIDLSTAADDGYAVASALGSFGTTAMMRGELERGLELLSRSIENSDRHGYRTFVCTGLRSRAMVHTLLGRLAAARADATRSLELAEDMNNAHDAAVARVYLAEALLAAESEPDTVADALDAAIAALEALKARFDLGNALVARGALLSQRERHAEAQTTFDGATALFRDAGFRYGVAWSELRRAESLLAVGDSRRAAASAGAAVELAAAIDAAYLEARGHIARQRASTTPSSAALAELSRSPYADVAAQARAAFTDRERRGPG